MVERFQLLWGWLASNRDGSFFLVYARHIQIRITPEGVPTKLHPWSNSFLSWAVLFSGPDMGTTPFRSFFIPTKWRIIRDA